LPDDRCQTTDNRWRMAQFKQ